MGYEIAGGLGVKMARPDREVFVMVGDGSYLMLPASWSPPSQEGVKIIIVLLDNQGYQSIGALSDPSWSPAFRDALPLSGQIRPPRGGNASVDLAANAASLGARAVRVADQRTAGGAGRCEGASVSGACGHPPGDRPAGACSGWWRLVGRAGRGAVGPRARSRRRWPTTSRAKSASGRVCRHRPGCRVREVRPADSRIGPRSAGQPTATANTSTVRDAIGCRHDHRGRVAD